MERDPGMAERARVAWLAGAPDTTRLTSEIMADFAAAEVRRELESLRAEFGWTPPSPTAATALRVVCAEIDRRLALLGVNDNGPESRATDEALAQTDGEACGSSGGPRPADPDAVGSERLTSGSPARLIEDAETLERAAELVMHVPTSMGPMDEVRRIAHETRGRLLALADALRRAEMDEAKLRASAAAPAPDWAGRLARNFVSTPRAEQHAVALEDGLAAFLRERLGPVVRNMTHLAGSSLVPSWIREAAQAALRKLEDGQ